ncbi:bifunctional ADP-dependent NAD(P)H-hydrate dehydratase/NAD(P)H-hydrate epimerase [Nemorincola caseinilytica]|uniref:Bifunctional NAD(P)H-hydrate repair enzyme n=1 Tax=Nemorincola caseinilytica TaxID=2054315 RepID=A0ABP8N534_9BACT
MKIFSAAQIRACDAYTIKAASITSQDLMERAAMACVTWIQDHMPKDSLFLVLCGQGNNGGDGLAIARLLHRSGYGVRAFVLRMSEGMSDDANANLQRLQAIDNELVGYVGPGTFISDIPRNIVIIDAILGTGVNRALGGWPEQFVQHVNDLPNRKIAIDMPSGLQADAVPGIGDTVLRANDTLSFQFYKRSFLHAEAGPYTGRIHVLDIGLDANFIRSTHTLFHATEQDDVAGIYRPRQAFGHKGTYGSVLLVGGSYGKIGAMVLATKAALRAGAGTATALVPSCGYPVMQTAVPEAMCMISGIDVLNNIEYNDRYTVGIGPGMGTAAETTAALTAYLAACRRPAVLDADALNILAAQPELLSQLPKGSVITPHPKEFARLFGENTNSMVQVDNARMQAMRYNINIVLKGRYTAVINTDGECRYNTTGNAGMATAGSGDVLTGIITGLMAQGYEPYHAALLGVYLHGAAGDAAAATRSEESMIAGDIVEGLGIAYKNLATEIL